MRRSESRGFREGGIRERNETRKELPFPHNVRSAKTRAKVASLLALVIIFWAACASAAQLVVQKEVSVSRALAGLVSVQGTDEAASGVTVELCSSGWKRVIASTKTDAKGHFSLDESGKAGLFYLRFSAPGMDIYQLRVRIDRHAARDLKVHLSVAT